MLGDTVNERAVRILLECNLVNRLELVPVVFSFDLVLLSGAIILDLACSECFDAKNVIVVAGCSFN